MPIVKSPEETLEKIIESKCSIARFGDGEISILVDRISYPFQKYSRELADRMKEILQSDDEKILIGLPIGFYSMNNMNRMLRRAWKAHIALVYPRFCGYIDFGKTYYNANITRPYMGYNNIAYPVKIYEMFRKIWYHRDLLIIEGEASRLGVGNDLFAGAKSIKRILAPPENAFEKYLEIYSTAKRSANKNMLLLIALGPTATVLAYDLSKAGFQALDVGNIDIEYEWFLRGATFKEKIPGKYTSEARGGREVSNSHLNEEYHQEIIARII